VSAATALVALIVGFGGVILGALLTRRNERRLRADDLLAQALNDAVAAISEVAGGSGDARALYASAVSRVALHAPPDVVESWRRFQDDATTTTEDGRTRLVAAIQSARTQLGHDPVPDADLHILLFGSGKASRQAVTQPTVERGRARHPARWPLCVLRRAYEWSPLLRPIAQAEVIAYGGMALEPLSIQLANALPYKVRFRAFALPARHLLEVRTLTRRVRASSRDLCSWPSRTCRRGVRQRARGCEPQRRRGGTFEA
jgi:hypothetical protein